MVGLHNRVYEMKSKSREIPMRNQMRNPQQGVRRCAAFLTVLVLLGSTPLFAELGGNLDSVQADQARIKANATASQTSAYTVFEIKSPLNTIVREYARPDGTVFGVAWQGPFIPDMRQLLGSYFGKYARAVKAQRETTSPRTPLNIHEEGLIVQTAGHMRAFSGRVYDPRLIPAGVSENDIR